MFKLLGNLKWAFEDWWDASTIQGKLACRCIIYVVECNQTFCVILMHHSFLKEKWKSCMAELSRGPLHQEALLYCCSNAMRKSLLTVISAFEMGN